MPAHKGSVLVLFAMLLACSTAFMAPLSMSTQPKEAVSRRDFAAGLLSSGLVIAGAVLPASAKVGSNLGNRKLTSDEVNNLDSLTSKFALEYPSDPVKGVLVEAPAQSKVDPKKAKADQKKAAKEDKKKADKAAPPAAKEAKKVVGKAVEKAKAPAPKGPVSGAQKREALSKCKDKALIKGQYENEAECTRAVMSGDISVLSF